MQCLKHEQHGDLSSLKIRGRIARDKTRAVSVWNSFKNDPLLVDFAFSFNCLL